jgi:Uma2 family endonuclease
MGMAAETRQRWTAREVRDLIAAAPLATPRYELVAGELLVTPSPSWSHQEAIGVFLVAFTEYLERQPIGHVLASPSDVELESEAIKQPDIYVMPTREWQRLREEGFPVRELLVAIEVLSPSSGRYDRVTKRAVYQRHVDEYWIVDLDARLVERWQPRDDRPQVVTETLEWRPVGANEPFRLDVAAFCAKIFGDPASS